MTHLPFIVAAYAVFAVAVLYVSIDAALRLRHATRRLHAIDHRKAAP